MQRYRGRIRFSLAVLVVLLATALVPTGASAERYVYVSNGFPAGSNNISVLRINSSGSLTPISGSPFATGGTITEGLSLTPDAQHLYVATFGTGDVRGFNIGATGGLSAVPGSPFATGSTPLGTAPSPVAPVLFDWNHGSAIGVWTINPSGSLTQIGGSPFSVPATQSNPFAGSVAPNGQNLYVPNENSTETVPGCGGTCEVNRVTSYSVAGNGALAPLQGAGVITGTTNVKAGGPNPFGSSITPDGNFVYVSNPEDGTFGTISGFAVNANGTLSSQLPGFPLSTGPGNHPLAQAISPDGQHLYVATRLSNTVNAYTINSNGSLSSVPGSPFATGGTNGKALALTPDGERLYVSNNGSDDISGFNVAANGSLTLISGSPWPTGGTDPDLESIAITPNQGPSAAFDVKSKPKKKSAKFDGSGSSDSDGGTVATYDWDFGDGMTQQSTSPVVRHRYAQPGRYLVVLDVTDDEGCSVDLIFTGKATLCNGAQGAEVELHVIARKLTIKFKQSVEKFKGKLKAEKRLCRLQRVKLFRKRSGRDQKVGSDETNGRGKWQIPEPGADGRYYIQAKQQLQPSGAPCLSTKSKAVGVG